MPKLHPEPLLFCLAWTTLAVAGAVLGGVWAGVLLALGLLVVLMPASALILTRFEDFRFERQVRWGILVLSALALAVWLRA
ncbi:MAG TPA: hypothetical protein VIT38_03885 [Allosphingosinicella sp.]|jgi:uncharacterized protein (DUF58 family)